MGKNQNPPVNAWPSNSLENEARKKNIVKFTIIIGQWGMREKKQFKKKTHISWKENLTPKEFYTNFGHSRACDYIYITTSDEILHH